MILGSGSVLTHYLILCAVALRDHSAIVIWQIPSERGLAVSQFDEIRTFVAQSKRITRMAELQVLLDQAVEALGFDFYALGHHVDLELPPGDAIVLIKYPPAWLDMMIKQKYYIDDPVLAATQRAVASFIWEDVPRYVKLSARQKQILEHAPRLGLGAGFTVPVHVAGEFSGSCNFGVRTGRELPVGSLPAAQYLGCFAFESARRIRRIELARGARQERNAALSPRQLDCLVLMARGLSDKEIARVLSIRPDTVHEYVEEAKQRAGVRKRPELLVRALYDGDLSFADVLGARSP